MIQWLLGDPIIRGQFAYHSKDITAIKYFFSSQTLLDPEIYAIKLIFEPYFKTLFFFNVGRHFDVS